MSQTSKISFFPNSKANLESADDNHHNDEHGGGNGGGGSMLEARVAKLEADIEYIKRDIADIKIEQRTITANTSTSSSDIKVVLQKLVDIDTSLTSKASKDFVESVVSGMKVWMLGILLLSIAMPVITFLLNLYLKKS